MFPAIAKPKVTSEKIAELKPLFDKLVSYTDRLIFWYNNGLDVGMQTYGITDDVDKRDLPENNISIYPQNNSEVKEWKNWYYEIFHRDNFNTLATSKAKYAKFITDGANPVPLTKKIIAEIEQEYTKHDKIQQFNMCLYCTGFECSQNGTIKAFLNNDYFPNPSFHMSEFCLGVVHEQYKRFLEQRLKELEFTEEQCKYINKEDNTEKLKISLALIGTNKEDYTSPVFHHIEQVLKKYNLTPIAAKKIMLETKGGHSPNMNANIVEPIISFLERISLLIETETKPVNPKTVFDKELSEIGNSENEFWKGFPMKEVITHFKVLTTKENKNGITFLTTEQFISFLKKGFLKDTSQPMQKINLANGEKGFVIKRFYEFFDLAVSQYSELNKKDKYIKLLSDNFDNWDYKSIKLFFKPNKTRQEW